MELKIMIQAILKKGRVTAQHVPLPSVSEGAALIKVLYSCISVGTETASVQASNKSLIKRALEQPENVKKVLHMARSAGISETFEKVKKRWEMGSDLGYSLSGIILALGNGIKDFKVGDRVACAGSGIANHAEYVDVPRNLIVRIPDDLGFGEASTVALGSIAMQGARRAEIAFGEYVLIFGLGAIGQIILQIAKNAGARVIGIDLDERRLKVGNENGADLVLNSKDSDIVKEVIHFCDGYGADKVVFTAATTSSTPLHQAFQMTRKKGKVVLVGVSGMQIEREDLYPKELDFLISTSYGPGRYDNQYERRGLDYPYAYVRWTENRNMQEYLRELAEGKIDLKDIIEEVYPVDRVEEAFDKLQGPNKPLLTLLEYNQNLPADLQTLYQEDSKVLVSSKINRKEGIISVALIGAGGFANDVHLPNLFRLKSKYNICAIMNKTPHKAKTIAEQYNAHYATCNIDDILNDKDIDLVLIATRHNLHGEYVLKALNAGKNVFVEKPLCIKEEDLKDIKEFYDLKLKTENSKLPLLMIGFNRRFSKYTQEAKKHTNNRMNPLLMHYRVNAGYIPLDHWVHGEEGGGRIIGEACHFIDLFTFFTECKVKEIYTTTLTPKTKSFSPDDNRVIVLNYEDGSIATLEYFATGSKEFPKEYMEIHFDEKTIIIDDFKSIKGFGVKVDEIKEHVSGKGHLNELAILSEVLQGKTAKWPIELWDMIQTTEVTFEIEKGDRLCVG
jgi:predicted dehydrogenase/threonine dehydrogenase-like Zn-dependent dehydrogenase